MKKLLLIAFALIALTITSCSYFSNHSTGEGKSSGKTKDDYPPELIEMVNQYQLVYYVTSDLIYDDKIIKDKAYLLGTYRYKTVDTIRQYKVVPFYCDVDQYQSLKKDGFFDLIQEIQDN